MTIAKSRQQHNAFVFLPWLGSSVRLAGIFGKPTGLLKENDELNSFFGGSNGTTAIESLLRLMTEDIHFEMSHQLEDEIDIEREIVVFLPPIEQRVVTLRVENKGEAQPFIVLDDLYQD